VVLKPFPKFVKDVCRDKRLPPTHARDIVSRHMADLTPQHPPQFEKAEYLGQPGANRCTFCKQETPHQYYRIGSQMACPACAMQIQRAAPTDSHAAFVRALLFGAGGAVLGLALYAGVEIATGWIIGYVALAVGFIVAKAMQMGSSGVGGRRYQIAAALLTMLPYLSRRFP
jgi:uncharacterized protein (DUF983 family)